MIDERSVIAFVIWLLTGLAVHIDEWLERRRMAAEALAEREVQRFDDDLRRL